MAEWIHNIAIFTKNIQFFANYNIYEKEICIPLKSDVYTIMYANSTLLLW